jgi:hypothetical protein
VGGLSPRRVLAPAAACSGFDQPGSCQAIGCALPPSTLPWALHVLAGVAMEHDAVVLELRLCREHGALLDRVTVYLTGEGAAEVELEVEPDEHYDDGDDDEGPPDDGGEAA